MFKETISRDCKRLKEGPCDRFGPIQFEHLFSRNRKPLRSVQLTRVVDNNKENENNIFCLPRITFSRIMETQLSLQNNIIVYENIDKKISPYSVSWISVMDYIDKRSSSKIIDL
jgi:hypothetical protein